ncbi:MAG TPA: Gfo/Idh/MocA family oxidoreductase [Phycisphaerae bacterium]|nr:Gfo/Idh/MocA family oxidoreductase [Phycisphaerae bacterium]
MSSRTTRRGFLKRGMALAGASAAAAFCPAPYILAGVAPKPKLGVAVVGGGGMGGYSVDQALRERLVALVEIDDGRIADIMTKKVKDHSPTPRVYHDYRKMLDECHRDIDVVLTATPDHNHAPAAIRAMNLGKHAFCQKPLAHNIRECYELAKAAKKNNVHTQMGNQRHCEEGYRRLCEYIAAGAIGNVTETHTILGRNFGGSGGRPASKPVPQGLHWDEWLGPAPYREYHDGLHPFSWRSWRQFGTGTVGDMACHHIDAPFWSLRLDLAKQFTVECLNTKGGSEEMFPQDNIILWTVPARGKMPPVKVYCYDHQDLKPEIMKETEKQYDRKFGEFTLFVGDKGLMGSDSRIIPEDKHKAFPLPEKTLPRAHGGPIEDLYYAIKNGGTACSNFIDAAGPLTAFILTGHLAVFAGVGKKLEWDVAKMQCTNLPEINQYVGRTYRKGWEV